MSGFILSLQRRKKYDKTPTCKIYTTSSCILRGRNIFWTPRAENNGGVNAPGAFLVLNKVVNKSIASNSDVLPAGVNTSAFPG